MCIICRMCEAGMSEQAEELATELFEAFQTSMAIHQEVLNEDRKHSAKEVAALYGMRDAMVQGNEPPIEALQELFGKNVKVVVVRPNEGENIKDAINKVMNGDSKGKLH